MFCLISLFFFRLYILRLIRFFWFLNRILVRLYRIFRYNDTSDFIYVIFYSSSFKAAKLHRVKNPSSVFSTTCHLWYVSALHDKKKNILQNTNNLTTERLHTNEFLVMTWWFVFPRTPPCNLSQKIKSCCLCFLGNEKTLLVSDVINHTKWSLATFVCDMQNKWKV